MFDSREFQHGKDSSSDFTHHGVPPVLTEEDAITMLKEAASRVRKREWCEAKRTLDALQFATCLDVTPVGNPLLSRIVDKQISSRGATLLALAVSNGAPPALVEKLLDWGAKPQIKLSGKIKGGEDTDLSLLHLAFANDHLDLIPLLLQVGVKTDDRSGLGYDPLSYYLRSSRDSSHVDDRLEIALREVFAAGGSFAARGPTGISHLEGLSQFCPTILITSCLALEARRAVQLGTTTFSRNELYRHAIAEVGESDLLSKRALECLSTLWRYAPDDGVEGVELPSLLSARMRQYAADKDALRWLTDGPHPFVELMRQIGQHADLFPPHVVTPAINQRLGDEDLSPTPLFLLVTLLSRDRRHGNEIVELALRLGADPNSENKFGATDPGGAWEMTPLDEALHRRDLGVAELLLSHGAAVSAMRRPHLLPKVLTPPSDDPLMKKEMFKEEHSAEEYLFHVAGTYPNVFAAFHGPKEAQEILTRRFASLSPYLQFKVVGENPSLTFLRPLLPGGPDLFVQRTIERMASLIWPRMDHQAPFLALAQNEALSHLLQLGKLAEARLLLKYGCPIPRAYFGERIPSELSINEFEEVRKRLIEDCEELYRTLCGADLLPNSLEELSSWRPPPFSRVGRYGDGIVAEILRVGGDVQDALTIASILQRWSLVGPPKDNDPLGRELAEFLPKLLHRYPLSVFSILLQAIEFDGNMRERAAYPNIAEAFAAFHHPEVIQDLRSDELGRLNVLTAAMSSFTYFIGHHRQVTGSAVNAWRAIAKITHGHKRYRFETKRQYGVNEQGEPRVELRSFFETFGAKRAPQISKDHPFQSAYLFHGRGYLRPGEPETPAMKGLDDRCVVVRYRAGEVFFDPSIGYIFTRNSSLTFGRDLVPSPCYFVPVAGVMAFEEWPFLFKHSAEQDHRLHTVAPRRSGELLHEIQNLTPEILMNSAYPLMEPLLYPHGVQGYHARPSYVGPTPPEGTRYGIELIEELLLKRERFEREYRRFVFDTDLQTAWQKDAQGNDLLVGAFNSPGFGKWLKRLRAQYNEAQYEALLNDKPFVPPHVLECHNPDSPPFSPYARLVLTDEVLTLLEKLAKEGWPAPPPDQEEEESEESDGEVEMSDLEDEGIYALITTALRTRGELIVVANNP